MECGSCADKRRRAVAEMAREWGCSERSVYRAARAGGWDSGRRARADKGKRAIPQEQIRTVVSLIEKSKRKDRHTIMDMETAVDVAASAGLLSSSVSVSTMNRYLRHDRMSRRQMEHDIDHGPHINMISKHPNHVHQFDITNCIQYFFGGGPEGNISKKSLGHRDMKKEFYVKKPENFKKIKKSLLRFMLVDHFSNVFYCQYRYATGERAIDVAEFLIESWGHRDLSACRDHQDASMDQGGCACGRVPTKYPFRGLPEILVMDRGSANMSDMVMHLCGSLGVEVNFHLPGNPRAKGSVEGIMWIWEQKFESRLSIQPAPDLDTLNKWAFEFCVRFNAEKPLSRDSHQRSRSKIWLSIPPEKLKLLPPMDVCKELLRSKPEERTVQSNLIVKYKGGEFRAPDPNLEGKRISVALNPYRWTDAPRCVDITYIKPDGEIVRYEALEVSRHPVSGFMIGPKTAVWGEEYSSWKDTDTQANVKELPSIEQMGEIRPFDGHFERAPHLVHIPPKGHQLEMDETSEAPEISSTQAAMMLRDILGRPLEPHEAEALKSANALTRDTVKELGQRILEKESHTERTEDTEKRGA